MHYLSKEWCRGKTGRRFSVSAFQVITKVLRSTGICAYNILMVKKSLCQCLLTQFAQCQTSLITSSALISLLAKQTLLPWLWYSPLFLLARKKLLGHKTDWGRLWKLLGTDLSAENPENEFPTSAIRFKKRLPIPFHQFANQNRVCFTAKCWQQTLRATHLLQTEFVSLPICWNVCIGSFATQNRDGK